MDDYENDEIIIGLLVLELCKKELGECSKREWATVYILEEMTINRAEIQQN